MVIDIRTCPLVRMIGAFYQVLLVGLAAVWLADPESAPTSGDLLAAMRAITARAET
jgi:hypothetical protein